MVTLHYWKLQTAGHASLSQPAGKYLLVRVTIQLQPSSTNAMYLLWLFNLLGILCLCPAHYYVRRSWNRFIIQKSWVFIGQPETIFWWLDKETNLIHQQHNLHLWCADTTDETWLPHFLCSAYTSCTPIRQFSSILQRNWRRESEKESFKESEKAEN